VSAALFEKGLRLTALEGHPVSSDKEKAGAVLITKRNLDFLRVEDFGKLNMKY
jgi:hypothetical protein